MELVQRFCWFAVGAKLRDISAVRLTCEVEWDGTGLEEGIEGLMEGRVRRCPMSGGVDIEWDRGLASGFAATGVLGWVSWVNTGWLHDWVGVFGGVENPEAVDRFKTMCSLRQPYWYETAGKHCTKKKLGVQALWMVCGAVEGHGSKAAKQVELNEEHEPR